MSRSPANVLLLPTRTAMPALPHRETGSTCTLAGEENMLVYTRDKVYRYSAADQPDRQAYDLVEQYRIESHRIACEQNRIWMVHGSGPWNQTFPFAPHPHLLLLPSLLVAAADAAKALAPELGNLRDRQANASMPSPFPSAPLPLPACSRPACVCTSVPVPTSLALVGF